MNLKSVTYWQLRKEDMPVFEAICQRERAPYAVVGEATQERHLTLEDAHFDNTPIDMPMDILLGKPPKMHRDATTLKVDSPALEREGIESAKPLIAYCAFLRLQRKPSSSP